MEAFIAEQKMISAYCLTSYNTMFQYFKMYTCFTFSITDSSVGEPPTNVDPYSQDQQSWSSWAWSYVPQILPEAEDEEGLNQPRRKPLTSIFSLGMYAYKLTVKFKVAYLFSFILLTFFPFTKLYFQH